MFCGRFIVTDEPETLKIALYKPKSNPHLPFSVFISPPFPHSHPSI